MRLIIATGNLNKFKEIKKILDGLDMEVTCLESLAEKFRVKEDGKTFFENALKKAKSVSRTYKDDFVAGEDSGLEVKVLGGRPGIFSKRYSGKRATDLRNNLKLLKKLESLDFKHRRAKFRCVLALVRRGKLVKKFEGTLEGFISDKIKGKGGFGYDPIFYLHQYRKTVAQLPLTEKNKISHRAKAFKELKKYLTGIT